jgi:hypothetical protein
VIPPTGPAICQNSMRSRTEAAKCWIPCGERSETNKGLILGACETYDVRPALLSKKSPAVFF